MAEACCSCLGQLRHVELWLLSVWKKGAVVCGDGCEGKGAGSEFHRMSEHCQSSPFYPLPLLITFPPEKSAIAWRSLLQRGGVHVAGEKIASLKRTPNLTLYLERKVMTKSSCLYRNWNSFLPPLSVAGRWQQTDSLVSVYCLTSYPHLSFLSTTCDKRSCQLSFLLDC